MRVDGDYRPITIAHGSFGSALNIQIDCQFEALTGYRRLAAQHAYFPAVAVHDNVLRTIRAAEQLIVRLLDA